MKALASFLLFSVVLGAGCIHFPQAESFNSCGTFAITNSAGVSTGTVVWGNRHDANTNDIQFVLILPETAEAGCGAQSWGGGYYVYGDLKIKSNGHRWKIEARRTMNTRLESLQLFDSTAQMEMKVYLQLGRYWRVSENGMVARLDTVDEAITRKVLHESEVGRIYSMRAPSFGK